MTMENGQMMESEGEQGQPESGADDVERMQILSQVESGQIDVEEALRRLGQAPTQAQEKGSAEETWEQGSTQGEAVRGQAYQHWKWLFLAVALSVTSLGGWLGTLGGWWWLCGAPTLFVGVLLLTLSVVTSQSPWLHVRLHTGQESWPRRIAISLPVPVRWAAWGLRTWGPKIDGLKETGLDELLMALDGNISADAPLVVDVQEDPESGERIQVFFG